MKKIFKNKKIMAFAVCVVILAIVIIACALLSNNTQTTYLLYSYSYTNYAWSKTEVGLYIYSDGTMEEYDKYGSMEETPKSAKITKDEIKKLINLANSVEDSYEKDNSIQMFDAGTETYQIYNSNLDEWIVLKKFGDSMGENNTETAQEILEFVEELEEKYLN